MKRSTSIALYLFVAILLGSLPLSIPIPAFAGDVLQEMLQLQTVHEKIETYDPSGKLLNTQEIFIQQPDSMRIETTDLTTPPNPFQINKSNASKPVDPSDTDVIITSTQKIHIDHERQLVQIRAQKAVDAQYEIYSRLENIVAPLYIGDEFKKTGTQILKRGPEGPRDEGVQTDKYESDYEIETRHKYKLFLDPASGSPMRCEEYVPEKNSRIFPVPDVLLSVLDPMEVNAVIPPNSFHFDIPEKWSLLTVDPWQDCQHQKVASAVFGIRFAIELDERRTLLCWYVLNDQHLPDDLFFYDPQKKPPIILGNEKIVFHEKLLHADLDPLGFHWRWSLISTDQTAKSWPRRMTMAVETPYGLCAQQILKVKFGPAQLPNFVEQAQRTTLPADKKDAKPMTVEEIEAIK